MDIQAQEPAVHDRPLPAGALLQVPELKAFDIFSIFGSGHDTLPPDTKRVEIRQNYKSFSIPTQCGEMSRICNFSPGYFMIIPRPARYTVTEKVLQSKRFGLAREIRLRRIKK
jgi:hypothetical protein